MTNMFWNHQDAIEATGGKATKPWRASGAEFDSRVVKSGDLFFAMKGQTDGHTYVKAALEKGAAAAVVSHVPDGLQDAPLLIVPDVEKALWDMATYNRARTSAKIIGVTGSVGKTGTKEALKLVLSAQGKTYATEGNFNNHIGVPLSLCRFDPAFDFGIFEMGMNHANEIRPLSKLAKPHAAIITTVEAVHLEFFKNVEEIADAKAEIFEGLVDGGIAIIPADNPHRTRLQSHAQHSGVRTIVSFGAMMGAEFQLVSIAEKDEGQEIEARVNGKKLTYFIPALGRHLVINSLAVLAGVAALGGDVKKAAETYKQYHLAEGRGAPYALEIAGKQITLLDDSYNASPASMKAAFAVLKARAKKGRAVAALGEMRELGETGPALHKSLAEELQNLGIDQVFTACPLMEHLYSALPKSMQGGHAKTAEELLPLLKNHLKTGDTLLIKGSHGSLMWKLAETLKTEGTNR